MTIDDRYQLQGMLGRGGHGAVFKAWDVTGERLVAVKLLQRNDDQRHVRRFRREVAALTRLSHPSLVRILGTGTTADGCEYLTMDLVPGESLQHHLAETPPAPYRLTEGAATELGICVLDGLAAAHALGIVHRDIKPGNIMVGRPGSQPRYKLIDFGLARHESASMLTENVVGTPAYMSPEQCMAEVVDGRTDLYALGLVLYRALSGQLPWGELPGARAMFAHVYESPRDIRAVAGVKVSEAFAAIVMTAIARSPERRFRSAEQMAAALRQCAQVQHLPNLDLATIDDAVPVAALPLRRAPRSSLRGWVLAAAAVAALAGLAAVQVHDRGPAAQTKPPIAPATAISAHPAVTAPPLPNPLPPASTPAEPGRPQAPPSVAAPPEPAPARPVEPASPEHHVIANGSRAASVPSRRPARGARPRPAPAGDPYSVLPPE